MVRGPESGGGYAPIFDSSGGGIASKRHFLQ
jgi:hypothetical protein